MIHSFLTFLWWYIYYQWCLYFYQKDFMVSCIFTDECVFYYVLGQRWHNKQVKSNQSWSSRDVNFQLVTDVDTKIQEIYSRFDYETLSSLVEIMVCHPVGAKYEILGFQDSKVHGGRHGAHLGPVGPRWVPCWLHDPCSQGLLWCMGSTGPHHTFILSKVWTSTDASLT